MEEKKEVNIAELIQDYKLKKMRIFDILRKYGIHCVEFYKILEEVGIEKRGRKGKRKNNIILV